MKITASLDRQAEAERNSSIRQLQTDLRKRLLPTATASATAGDVRSRGVDDATGEEWSALQVELAVQERERAEAARAGLLRTDVDC